MNKSLIKFFFTNKNILLSYWFYSAWLPLILLCNPSKTHHPYNVPGAAKTYQRHARTWHSCRNHRVDTRVIAHLVLIFIQLFRTLWSKRVQIDSHVSLAAPNGDDATISIPGRSQWMEFDREKEALLDMIRNGHVLCTFYLLAQCPWKGVFVFF